VPVLNLVTGLPGVPVGGTAVISASGLPASLSGWTLTINDAKVDFSVDSNSNLRAVIPAGTPIGPAVLRLTQPSGDAIPPILMNVDDPPPVIQAAFVGPRFIDAGHPAAGGDVIFMDVAHLYGSAPAIPPSNVHIDVGGVDHVATTLASMLQFGFLSDVVRVQFTLSSGLPSGSTQAAAVRVGTRVSPAYTLNVIPSVQPSTRN
jgi:hypothetical protein